MINQKTIKKFISSNEKRTSINAQPTLPLTFASLDIDFDDWYGKNYPNQDEKSEHLEQTNLAFVIYKLTCEYLSPETPGYKTRRQALSALLNVKTPGFFNKKAQAVPLRATDKATLQAPAAFLKDDSTKTLASQVIKACLAQKALPKLTSTPAQGIDDFNWMPSDMAKYISFYCDLPTANNLMLTCRAFFDKTKESVDKRKVAVIAEAIMKGHFEDKIQKFILKNPAPFLTMKVKVKDLAGHTIVGADGTGATLYEMVIGSGFWEVAEFLTSLFTAQILGTKTDEQAQAIRLAQHNRQLPNGWVDDENTVIFTKGYANNIIDTIINASDADVKAALEHKNDATVEANQTALRQTMDTFRHDLDAKRVVKAGKHVNHLNLLNAIQVYTDRYDDFQSDEQRILYWIQIIGYIQRDETAALAKKFVIGLDNIKGGKAAVWDGTFKFNNGYIPVGSRDNSGGGFHFWGDFNYGIGLAGFRADHVRAALNLEKFLAANTRAIDDLNQSAQHTNQPGYVID